MGRAINQESRLDGHDVKFKEHDKRIKLIEGALEELVQTRVHHVDLHGDMDKHEEKVRKENSVVVEPDEEFTPPSTGKRKSTRKTKTATTA
jgi:hypothetical protein|tara:strand:- start:224 stop:496 length:273 start_codon:yes stop_codon:yes gene_type:complete